MNPVAFSIGNFEVAWYGIIISFGIFLGAYVAYLRCSKYNIDFDNLLNVLFVTVPLAIVGARIYYVVFSWDYYSANPAQILNIRGGGLAIHGAILMAIIAGYFSCKKFKVDFLKALDLVAPSLIIGQAIGRWGNFFNQEAHGGAVSSEFISHFPNFIQKGMFIDGTYYHPTFLYESIWNLLIFALLLFLSRKRLKDGILFLYYLLFYSIGRFFIEGLRTDSLMIGPLRMAQVISLVFIFVSIIFIVFITKRKKYSNPYS